MKSVKCYSQQEDKKMTICRKGDKISDAHAFIFVISISLCVAGQVFSDVAGYLDSGL